MILGSPINLDMVNTFRGVVDFYYWRGVPIARSWPRKPNQPGTPAQQVAWSAFRNMFAWKKSNPYGWNQRWNEMFFPATMSAEDARRKYGLRLAYADALWRPPDITKVETFSNTPAGKTTVEITVNDYADFDETKVNFRIVGYSGPYKILSWYESYQEVNRQGVPTTRYEPNLAEYFPPESVSWDNIGKVYTLVIEGLHAYASVFGVVDKVTPKLIMLSPLYDSQD